MVHVPKMGTLHYVVQHNLVFGSSLGLFPDLTLLVLLLLKYLFYFNCIDGSKGGCSIVFKVIQPQKF